MRTRKVGTITLGCMLVIFGILFLLNMVMPVMTYIFIFRWWPIVFVFLGIEVLIGSMKSDTMIYDKGAVFLMFLLALFAVCMAAVDSAIRYQAFYMGM